MSGKSQKIPKNTPKAFRNAPARGAVKKRCNIINVVFLI